MVIAVLGNGSAARRFGSLFQTAGHEVLFGARKPDKASGVWSLPDAAGAGELILIAIPFGICHDVLPRLAPYTSGKIVIDATNPTNHEDWSPILLGEENSGGEEIARLLPRARVVKALNTVFADVAEKSLIDKNGTRLTGFLASDDVEAAKEVENLTGQIGFDPLFVGPLRLSRYLEAMSHLNIALAVGQGHGTYAGFIYDYSRR